MNRLVGRSRFFLKDDVFGDDGGVDVEELNFVFFVDWVIVKEYVSFCFFIKFDMEWIRDFGIILIFKYMNVSEIGFFFVLYFEWSGVRRNSFCGKLILYICSIGDCFFLI